MFVRYPCPPPLLGSFFDRILLNRKGVTLDGEFIAKNIKEKGGSGIDWGFDPSPNYKSTVHLWHSLSSTGSGHKVNFQLVHIAPHCEVSIWSENV